MALIGHFTCPSCNTQFDKVFHSQREKDRCKGFCSQKCANSKTLAGKIKQVQCSCCGKPTKCGLRSNPRLVKCPDCRKPGTDPREAQSECSCSVCGKPTTWRYPTCSRKCASQAKQLEVLARFNAGLINQRQTLRKVLEILRGWSCSICGLETWTGVRAPLEVDHIDGDPTNNQPDNLRLLCCNCHALTPTWGAKNKGKGRKSRGVAKHY